MKTAFFALLCAALLLPYAAPAQTAAPALPAYTTLSDIRVLGLIRQVYRSHRPPPPYEIYTMVRSQMTNYGYPDYAGSYTTKYWVRNLDRAALTRQIFRDDAEGDLVFQRPELNEATDPGPPTADLFAQAPVTQHTNPLSYVPTPEPTSAGLKTIVSVTAYGERDYYVTKIEPDGELLHLVLKPRRDPERNVLREIWVDKHTYELRKVIAHDRLFTPDQGTFPVIFTYTLGYLRGVLVVTHLHGIVEPRTESNGAQTVYGGDGATVDFDFKDIEFPSSMPDWYFNPREYAPNKANAPE